MVEMIKLLGTDEEIVEKGLIDEFYSHFLNDMGESDFELVYDWGGEEFFGVRCGEKHNCDCVLKSLRAYVSEGSRIDYEKFNGNLYQQRYIHKMA